MLAPPAERSRKIAATLGAVHPGRCAIPQQPRVEQVPAALTVSLRQRVLRPHQSLAELTATLDPAAVTFAALDPAGAVLATAALSAELPPWRTEPGPAGWRLRGMATEPERRGQGLGAAVLAAVLDHVAARGGGELWCHARLPAVEFYRRAGLVPLGRAWEEPHIGPHIAMHRSVAPPARPR